MTLSEKLVSAFSQIGADMAAAVAIAEVLPVYNQTDAGMASVTVPATADVILRRPTGSTTGQVAPQGQATFWARATLPTSDPYFTTAGDEVWTQVSLREDEILSILLSSMQTAFENPVMTGTASGSALAGKYTELTGKILQTGSFGIGEGTSLEYYPNGDLNSGAATGVYRYDDTTLNRPPGGSEFGTVLNFARLAVSAYAGYQQLAFSLAGDISYRGSTGADGASWEPWTPIVKAGDNGLTEPIQLSGSTSLSGRNLKTGFYTYVASNVPGGPESISWTHTLHVLESGITGRRTFIDIRLGGETSQVMWWGSQSAADGPIHWTEISAPIQRGSNANGEWTKFPDGTMICTHTGPAVATGLARGALWGTGSTLTWTFPQSFIAPPAVSGSGGGISRWPTFSPPTETNVGWIVMSYESSAVNSSPTFMAVGRWKNA